MKRIFSQIFSHRNNYVTTTTPTVTAASASNKELGLIRHKSHKTVPIKIPSRNITIGTGQGSNVGPAPAPVVSNSAFSGAMYNYQYKHQEVVEEDIVPVQPPPLVVDRSAGYYYSSLLNAAADVALSSNSNSSEDNKSWLIQQLSLKRVLSKNKEMKKIILKVAAMAVSNENGEFNNSIDSLHPFIPTAGEVFFGANSTNNEDGEVAEASENIQDILTPGILVLLLDKLVQGNSPGQQINPNQIHSTVSNRHLLLAKALVETSAGYLIHRTIQETNHLNENSTHSTTTTESLHQGNKLATLTGDLLVVSVIKHVASTGNNKVLELTMNSLSEFSTTEFSTAEVTRSQKPFQTCGNPNIHKALLPKTLAESIVFSEGFQSAVILSGINDTPVQEWAGKLGALTGLLWKTNFDYKKLHLSGGIVENISEFNAYLADIRERSRELLNAQHKGLNNDVLTVLRELVSFWSTKKKNHIHHHI